MSTAKTAKIDVSEISDLDQLNELATQLETRKAEIIFSRKAGVLDQIKELMSENKITKADFKTAGIKFARAVKGAVSVSGKKRGRPAKADKAAAK